MTKLDKALEAKATMDAAIQDYKDALKVLELAAQTSYESAIAAQKDIVGYELNADEYEKPYGY